MTFNDIANQFETAALGTDAFKRLYTSVFEQMEQDPKHAGLYFVIGIAAQAYVRQYEDQAVSHELAQAAKQTLQSFNDKVADALNSSPEVKLQVMNDIASHYQLRNKDF